MPAGKAGGRLGAAPRAATALHDQSAAAVIERFLKQRGAQRVCAGCGGIWSKRIRALEQGPSAPAVLELSFNAINLALDAVWRLEGVPKPFYRDWAQVAKEEAYRFTLLHEHLRSMATSPDPNGQPVPRWDHPRG